MFFLAVEKAGLRRLFIDEQFPKFESSVLGDSQPPFIAQNNVAQCYPVQPSAVTSSFSGLQLLHLFLPCSIAQAIEKPFPVYPTSSSPLKYFSCFCLVLWSLCNISGFSELF